MKKLKTFKATIRLSFKVKIQREVKAEDLNTAMELMRVLVELEFNTKWFLITRWECDHDPHLRFIELYL